MLAVAQILLSIVMTIIYSVSVGINLDLFGVLGIILIFIIANVIVLVVILVLFAVFIMATEKISAKSMWKHYIINMFNIFLFRFLYRTRLIVTGQENLPINNNFVMYANHIEYSDPMYIFQAYKNFPIGFIAKDPLFKYPVLKNLMLGMGCIPITRFADRSALESIVKGIKQVKDGQPMGIFPEGKRTYCNDLIEFKPGAFKLAQKAKADISPACLYDMHKLANKWRLGPTKVYIHILPLVKYEDYKDLDSVQLAEKIYNIINTQMDKFKNKQE